jgi:hypothetical protein
VVRLRTKKSGDDGIHGLRALLKAARHFGLSCVSAIEETTQLPFTRTPTRPGRARRRSIPCGRHQETEMQKAELVKLKDFAKATVSPVLFSGVVFIQWDFRTGNLSAGKNREDFVGKQLVADVPQAMAGFMHLEKGQKPSYALVRLVDQQIERNELSPPPPRKDGEGERDYWTPCTGMSFFEQETRETFILLGAYDVRSELGTLIDAFVDENQDGAADRLPLVTFGVRKYPKNDGTTGYAIQFDIDEWVERPANVLKVQPPALNIRKVDKPTNLKDGKTSGPTRRISIPGSDLNDEIPF